MLSAKWSKQLQEVFYGGMKESPWELQKGKPQIVPLKSCTFREKLEQNLPLQSVQLACRDC